MRSVLSVTVGMLVAFVLVLLIVFGIIAPVLSELFQIQPSGAAFRTFAPLLLFVSGLAFYFGGMAGSYKAPGRRVLHGTLVAPAAFVVSPVVNLIAGKTPFPGLNSIGTVLLAIAFLAVSTVAAHVGARRGETLHAHNERVLRSMQRSSEARQRREAR